MIWGWGHDQRETEAATGTATPTQTKGDAVTNQPEGNGPSDEPVDDTTALDVADYEADLSGDPVNQTDEAIPDDLLEEPT